MTDWTRLERAEDITRFLALRDAGSVSPEIFHATLMRLASGQRVLAVLETEEVPVCDDVPWEHGYLTALVRLRRVSQETPEETPT